MTSPVDIATALPGYVEPARVLDWLTVDGMTDPLWYKDAIIYQLHVKAFFDRNSTMQRLPRCGTRPRAGRPPRRR